MNSKIALYYTLETKTKLIHNNIIKLCAFIKFIFIFLVDSYNLILSFFTV